MATSSLQPLGSTDDTSGAQSLMLAIAGFLANFKGRTRVHAESDLACFLRWCQHAEIAPLSARRVDLELYLRWMQNDRRFKPSTVSRRPVGGRWVLPHLCHRRDSRTVTGRIRSPAPRPTRVAHPRAHPPAVRGAAQRGP